MKHFLEDIFKKNKRFGAFAPNHSWMGMSPSMRSQENYEGYLKNSIAFRSISLIARSVASVPWTLYHQDTLLPAHPLLTLIDKVNPIQSRSTFFEALVSHYLISGNAFVEVISDDNRGLPLELYILRPDRVEIVLNSQGEIRGYWYRVDGTERWIDYQGDEGNLLHLKSFNPTDDWYGLSVLTAVKASIELFDTVTSHNLNLLKNGGRPTGALVVKTGAYGLSDTQRDSLRADIDAAYRGSNNAGRVLVLEGDFDWKEMGLAPKDLDFISGKLQSAREIAQACGVPPMLVGIPGDATFANYREARFHLWEDTVLPLLDHIINEFNIWLTPRYGPYFKLGYNMDAIPALSPLREAMWEKISQASFLTDEEKRQKVGFAPL